jgi:hypothetical protein
VIIFACFVPFKFGPRATSTDIPLSKYQNLDEGSPLEEVLGALEDLCQYFQPASNEDLEKQAKLIAKLAQGNFDGMDDLNPVVRKLSQWFVVQAGLQRIMDTACDREFFISRKGNVGLANGHVEEGDLIVLAPDLEAPAVFRRDLVRKGYLFVGHTKIDGMMKSKEANSDYWRLRRLAPDQEFRGIWDNLEKENLETFNLI